MIDFPAAQMEAYSRRRSTRGGGIIGAPASVGYAYQLPPMMTPPPANTSGPGGNLNLSAFQEQGANQTLERPSEFEISPRFAGVTSTSTTDHAAADWSELQVFPDSVSQHMYDPRLGLDEEMIRGLTNDDGTFAVNVVLGKPDGYIDADIEDLETLPPLAKADFLGAFAREVRRVVTRLSNARDSGRALFRAAADAVIQTYTDALTGKAPTDYDSQFPQLMLGTSRTRYKRLVAEARAVRLYTMHRDAYALTDDMFSGPLYFPGDAKFGARVFGV